MARQEKDRLQKTDMAKVKVPKEVFEGITAVRDSGRTNMLECAR